MESVHQDPLKLNLLFVGSLIVNTGISFIWPLTTIYLHETLHESLTVAGAVLFLNSLFTLFGNALGGFLFDRWRPYQTILCGMTIVLIATGLLIFFHGWPSYPILLLVLGIGNGIVVTTINAVATFITSKNPSYVFNVLYFTSNLGLVIGSLMVGFILPLGMRTVFSVAFVWFSFFWLLICFTYRGLNRLHRQPQKAMSHAASGKTGAAQRPVLIILLTMIFFAWIAYEQWNSTISTYLLHLHFSVRAYSFLWTLNAIVIVVLQPVLTHFDDFLAKHLRGRWSVGFILFASAFLLLVPAKHLSQFYLSMGILTIGEILSFPGVSTFVNDHAPQQDKGRYQGWVQAATSAGRAVGPLVGAAIVQYSSYPILFLFCSSLVFIGLVFFIGYDRHQKTPHA